MFKTILHANDGSQHAFKALSMALDRQRMIQTLYQGYGKPVLAHGWTFVFDKFPTDAQFGKSWRYDCL